MRHEENLELPIIPHQTGPLRRQRRSAHTQAKVTFSAFRYFGLEVMTSNFTTDWVWGEGPSAAECLVSRLLPLVFSSNSQPPSDYYRGAHENRAALTTNTAKTEDFQAVITSTLGFFFFNNNTMIIFYQLLSLFSKHRAIRKTWKYKYSKL